MSNIVLMNLVANDTPENFDWEELIEKKEAPILAWMKANEVDHFLDIGKGDRLPDGRKANRGLLDFRFATLRDAGVCATYLNRIEGALMAGGLWNDEIMLLIGDLFDTLYDKMREDY